MRRPAGNIINALLLAGGLGTRLRPFTEVIPKPLLPLGENALMEIQIASPRYFGCGVAEHLGRHDLSLPCSVGQPDEDIQRIARSLLELLDRR